MRGRSRAAKRLPRKSPVIMEATTVATAWWEFPRMRERERDQATSITREAAPEKKRQPESTLRAVGLMRGDLATDREPSPSWRSRARIGIRNRVGAVAVQRPP